MNVCKLGHVTRQGYWIMCTIGCGGRYVDQCVGRHGRYIDRYSDRYSVDMSTEFRRMGGRQVGVESRWNIGQVSVVYRWNWLVEISVERRSCGRVLFNSADYWQYLRATHFPYVPLSPKSFFFTIWVFPVSMFPISLWPCSLVSWNFPGKSSCLYVVWFPL